MIGQPAAAAIALDQAARAAMARRDGEAAQRAVQQLLQSYPNFAPAWLTASVLALDLAQPARALAAAEQGLKLDPHAPSLHIQYVRSLQANGERHRAMQAALAAERTVAANPPAQRELGNAFAALAQYGDALRLLDAALAQTPEDAAALFNRATVLRFLGRFAEAEASLDKAISHAPDDWEAYALRSSLRTQTASHNHTADLQALLARTIPNWAGEVQICHALAKEYEDLGDFQKSFAALAQGAKRRRENLRYDVAEDVATIDQIIAVLNKEWLAGAPPGHDDPSPIFVFGLPRSGTTLVERILSRHRNVVSLGELNAFPAALMHCAAAARGGARLPKQALVALSSQLAPAEIGAAYMARIKQHNPARPHFIDKLPMNYLYAGLIAAALPGARLVQVRRHKMANGYGMFKTLFNQGYPFSYDLNDLARYMAAHHRLMAHWQSLLGPRLITINYEALVADQEAQTRALLAACGLAWDEACLAPQDNPSPSLTQSAVQVRQPVYADAVNHWRNFTPQLAPLAARLLADGVPASELE